MGCSVTEESFDWFASYWQEHGDELRWETVFVLPPWVKVWRQAFAPETEPHLLTVRQEAKVIGIAPLLIREGTASIIGSPDICDYVDFIVAPGKESDFFGALLEDLKQKGVSRLGLGTLRPDSTAVSSLIAVARKFGYKVFCHQDDVSLEVDLPATWDEYLQMLNSKQRHEVRRKLRRLEEAGSINYRIIEESEAVPDFMDVFLRLFVESRKDKATFMTDEIAAFFDAMVREMAEAGLLRAGILEVGSTPVAGVIAFDYNDTIYLYNSGYDLQYRSLSVGILSKALYIKDSIQRGKKRFDFMKGDERYKYHLGGKEVPLYDCQIEIE